MGRRGGRRGGREWVVNGEERREGVGSEWGGEGVGNVVAEEEG